MELLLLLFLFNFFPKYFHAISFRSSDLLYNQDLTLCTVLTKIFFDYLTKLQDALPHFSKLKFVDHYSDSRYILLF